MAVGNRLTNMEFDEISLVTRPANQLSKVVLFKSDTDTEEHMTTDTGVEEIEETEVAKDEESDTDTLELPTEVFEYIAALEQANAELMQQVEKMADYDGGDDDEDFDVSDDIMKSADPRLVEIVKAAEERAAAAEAIAKSERDFRLEREYIGKAATLNNLPVNADDFGRVLKSVAEALDEDTYDILWRVLEAANESVTNGGLFKEIGKSVSTDNDGPATIIDKAAARIRSEQPNLTNEQAIAKALETDPTLYTAYLREVK